ncbi:hypothetical protein [uncultured Gemmiger sp.]|uniref:hypothetical protein n=1 Tax=uncultured Gemmiger sp. TaxID=1623490 RepID=UPI0025E24E7C|nr:hypothetical protein [uncultured Gemmiger sp.]
MAAEGFFGISFIQKQIFQAVHVQVPEALFIGIGQQVAQAIQNSVVPDFFQFSMVYRLLSRFSVCLSV